MMSGEAIREMSSRAAKEAKRRGVKPLVITEKIKAAMRAGESTKKIPFIGDYVPPGFVLMDTLFVDSSGFGSEDEAVISQRSFIENLEVGKAYAITEAGQFQVYVGAFDVAPRKKIDIMV